MVDGQLSRDGRAMRILMQTGETAAGRAATSRSLRTTGSGWPAARLTTDESRSAPTTAPNSTA
jgi:hypothetical protein